MSSLIDIHTHSRSRRNIEIVSVRLGSAPLDAERPVSAGIHPWDADMPSDKAACYMDILKNVSLDAIGETGLDYSVGADRAKQAALFESQLAIAAKRALPVIIHSVRAQRESMKILDRYPLRGVIFHGFTGSEEQMREIAKRGYFISFGFRTMQSPKTARALRSVPVNRLFLETDDSDRPIEEMYAFAAELRGAAAQSLQTDIFNNYQTLFQ